MQISATIKDGTADLTVTTVSSSSHLEIKGADQLADDLEQFLSDPDATAVERHYRIVPTDTGLSVQVQLGGFIIPWQYIMTVVNALRV
ncbi:hypothetical protein PEL8287_03694 [Roseovarius litorisediminis]|uniref:Uncharacterized protein n=1 Tax=Roseovarius litorisediminis TaxID=1312363 RepID=A0A1Y5TP39_9RHOB|nr:hypothetical protein [Roseovarius litorisediminis]SLN66641.1 hypothetical protein PEL8287_03694 [Roseovarius litorisediminis]